MDSKIADQLLRETAEEALKVQNARRAAQNAHGTQGPEEESAQSKRNPDDQTARGETSKRARTFGRSTAESVGNMGRFIELTLTQGIPEDTTELEEAAVLSAHAAYKIFLTACNEENVLAEKEADKHVIRTQAAQIERLKTQLNQEAKQRAELKRKVASLTLMSPVLKESQQEWQDAKVAQLAVVKQLELVRAELARVKADNAELAMAGLRQENAREEESVRANMAGGESSKAPQT